MKILIFHTYNQGYLSSFFHELAVKLNREGHEVVCFSWKATTSERIIDRIKILVKIKKGYITNYRNVFNVIKKERPDVILSNFSYVNPAIIFGQLFSIKRNIVWFHSLNAQMKPSKTKVFIKRQFLKMADIVIANSTLTKIELSEIYNVPIEKIETIAFWSNISEYDKTQSNLKFEIDNSILKIGCPGRMAAHKNHKIVLDALGILKEEEGKDFHLYLAGNGEEYNNLQKFSKELNLGNQVSFLEHLSAENMISFYNAMDVIVLPSLHEAFGLVFIEAISLGIPVIVSSQFGALSFLNKDKENLARITFNPESKIELAEKLRPYLLKKGLSKSYFKELYHTNFDKDVIFDKLLNVITRN